MRVPEECGRAIREFPELLHNRPVLIIHIALCEALRVGETRALRHGLTAIVLSGQQTAGQREIGEEAESVMVCSGQQFPFRSSHQEAVFILAGDEGIQITFARGPKRLNNLPRRKIRTSDVAHLSLMN